MIASDIASAEDAAYAGAAGGLGHARLHGREGSTRPLGELGAEAYRDALAEHRRVVREAFAAGYEIDEEGDAFFYALPRRDGGRGRL